MNKKIIENEIGKWKNEKCKMKKLNVPFKNENQKTTMWQNTCHNLSALFSFFQVALFCVK